MSTVGLCFFLLNRFVVQVPLSFLLDSGPGILGCFIVCIIFNIFSKGYLNEQFNSLINSIRKLKIKIFKHYSFLFISIEKEEKGNKTHTDILFNPRTELK